jgi:ribose/xylose/arabinose/galactoside ABC-type transport system permease subunit
MVVAVVVALVAARRLLQGCGAARLGLPSLVVTLAGLIGWRGAGASSWRIAHRHLPDWFDRLGQDGSSARCCSRWCSSSLLQSAGWCCSARRQGVLYVIGDNAEVAWYSVVARTRLGLFVMSSTVAAWPASCSPPARDGARRRGHGLRAGDHHHRPARGVSIFGGRAA